MVRTLLTVAALAAAADNAAAGDCIAESGPYITPVVELYTSQGCSSCPPAEQWLSGFTASPPGAIVAIEYHVNYWDSLGWKDQLADARYTERQRMHVVTTGARYPYTPQVVLAGRDMPLWRNRGLFEEAIARIRQKRALATIAVAPRIAGGAVQADVRAILDPQVDPRRHDLVVVLAENGLSTHVTAGENRGRDLAQDFVARDLRHVRLEHRETSRVVSLQLPRGATGSRLSVAAFIEDVATGEVMQAVSTNVCR